MLIMQTRQMPATARFHLFHQTEEIFCKKDTLGRLGKDETDLFLKLAFITQILYSSEEWK